MGYIDILNNIRSREILSKITDNIWIGNRYSVSNLSILEEYDVIINCSKDIPFYKKDNIINHRISVDDSNDITNIKNLETYLEMTADLLNIYSKDNKQVLVHCEDSVNLSPSIIIAYLIKYENKDLYEATLYIISKHSITFFIFPTFRLSLINYEYNIVKKNSKDIKYIQISKNKHKFFVFIIILILLTINIYTKYFKKKYIIINDIPSILKHDINNNDIYSIYSS